MQLEYLLLLLLSILSLLLLLLVTTFVISVTIIGFIITIVITVFIIIIIIAIITIICIYIVEICGNTHYASNTWYLSAWKIGKWPTSGLALNGFVGKNRPRNPRVYHDFPS